VQQVNFAEIQVKAKASWEAPEKSNQPYILVGTATCGRAAGALEVIDAIKSELTKNNIEALYDTGIATWKLGKTIWNPAVHFRNMFSNSVLLDLSGMDAIQQTKYIGKALKHIKGNDFCFNESFFKISMDLASGLGSC